MKVTIDKKEIKDSNIVKDVLVVSKSKGITDPDWLWTLAKKKGFVGNREEFVEKLINQENSSADFLAHYILAKQ